MRTFQELARDALAASLESRELQVSPAEFRLLKQHTTYEWDFALIQAGALQAARSIEVKVVDEIQPSS